MRLAAPLLAASFLLLAAVPARAGWSVGANLGVSVFEPKEGENVTTVQWPNQGSSPGLRIGWTPRDTSHVRWYLDAGASVTSSDATKNTGLQGTANVQYDWKPAAILSPYATLGAGIVMSSFEGDVFVPGTGSVSRVDASATGAVFGFGVGLRRRVAGGHGMLRGELRYDQFSEGKDGTMILIREGGTTQVRLGFDLGR